jgi:hypothetical protein
LPNCIKYRWIVSYSSIFLSKYCWIDNITNISTNILAKILLNCIIFLLKYYCIAINILIYIQIFKYYKYIHKIYLPKCFIFINILTEILLNCIIFIDILIYIEIFKYYKYIHKYTCQNIAELYHIHQYTCWIGIKYYKYIHKYTCWNVTEI